jgi:hypothetical protein
MPNKPEGHFWLGANLGGYAQLKGPLSGIAAAKRLREEMETVLKSTTAIRAAAHTWRSANSTRNCRQCSAAIHSAPSQL